ncbi:hypothetical protein F5884DRAFT_783565 [Xylogone sp. PMI_703]|nr:hypothetical protein F5884DRAFT_783565 [Xylogone sp. PMI_703]
MASTTNYCPRKKVAIIGSGCAGIGALWALNRTPHDVYIYEAADRLGGNTNSVEFKQGRYKTLVDTGFTVLNAATSPNFLAFLKAIGQPTIPTEMAFSVSKNHGHLEWSAASLSSVFAQRRNIFSLRMWRMIFDIIRFRQLAFDIINKDECSGNADRTNWSGLLRPELEESVERFLDKEGYSDAFRDDYLVPMTAALWNTTPDRCLLDFPVVTLVQFLWSHHLLSPVSSKPEWLTMKNGSRCYIDKVMHGFPANHLFLNTPVMSVSNDAEGRVRLHLDNGRIEVYDHVIIATHGDQAYNLIADDSSQEERAILSGFQTTKNTAVLHSDASLMPKRRATWTSCNYMAESSAISNRTDGICLTYNMNILQKIPKEVFGDVLLTLNPLHPPDPCKVQWQYIYKRHLYNYIGLRSQKLLPRIQNTRGISYCGSWTRHGFQEDAFSSGLKVAQDHLGAVLPFKLRDSMSIIDHRPVPRLVDLLQRVCILAVLSIMDILEAVSGFIWRKPQPQFKIKTVQWNGNGNADLKVVKN